MSKTIANAWLQEMKKKYRITPQTKTIVEVIVQTEGMINPHDILDDVHLLSPVVGRMTVYRVLEKLEELGLLRRLHSGCWTFLKTHDADGLVFLCRICGHQSYSPDKSIVASAKKLAEQHGYRLQPALLQVFGVCAMCTAGEGSLNTN